LGQPKHLSFDRRTTLTRNGREGGKLEGGGTEENRDSRIDDRLAAAELVGG
jgi:hypothetical protein